MSKASSTQQVNSENPVVTIQGMLQRKCACGEQTLAGNNCTECNKKNLTLQRKATNQPQQAAVPAIVHDVLGSSGQSLDSTTRSFFEPRFGHDFSGVKIHDNVKASESTHSVNALAYTVGNHVVFRTGQYNPHNSQGRNLLAHELTHVVQQSNHKGIVNRAIEIGSENSQAEIEADRVANHITSESPMLNLPKIHNLSTGCIALQRLATLKRTVTVQPRNLNCGGFTMAAQWGLNGADSSTNGFVIQKVTFNLNREVCAGGRNNFQKTYWEGWQVRRGVIYIGTLRSRHNADTFTVRATPDHKGGTYEEGKAKYIEGYTAPLSWGNVPEARSLPSTTDVSEVTGWSDSGTLHRYIGHRDFDCCGSTDLGDFYHQK